MQLKICPTEENVFLKDNICAIILQKISLYTQVRILNNCSYVQMIICVQPNTLCVSFDQIFPDVETQSSGDSLNTVQSDTTLVLWFVKSIPHLN